MASSSNDRRPYFNGVAQQSRIPLGPTLPSISYATACAALFANFIGTMGESDFSLPFITAYDPRSSLCGCSLGCEQRKRDLSVPEQKTYVHARVYRRRGANQHSR